MPPPHDLRRPLDVTQFGAHADGLADDGAAIKAALAALPPTGGVIYFPAGTYLFSSPLSWSATANVKFVGAGARYMQDFNQSPSRLVYTGSGTTPAIHVHTNYARGWQVEDLEIAHSNPSFRGSLIWLDSTAGISFKHCALGGASAGTASPSGAQAVVQIGSTEKVTFQECIIQYAQRGVWVPTCNTDTGTCDPKMVGHANGANNTALVTIRDSQLTNVTRAHVEVAVGGAIGTIIKDNLFDNTTLIRPPYGLLLSGDGFSITGNTFSGGDESKTPTAMYVDLHGFGDFSGNTILSLHPALRVNAGGSYHVSGNFVLGKPPFTIAGGAVSGAGNTWQAMDGGDTAVDVDSQEHAAVLDLGPDLFPSSSHHSYSIHSKDSPARTSGILRYDPRFDASTDGPTTESPFVTLQNLLFQSYYLRAPVGTTAHGAEMTLGAATIPARAIDKNGKGVRFHVSGTAAANRDTKRIRIVFGTAVLYDSGGQVAANTTWSLQGTIYRTESNRERCFIEGRFTGIVEPRTVYTAIDLTQAQTFSIFATGGATDGGITLNGLELDALQ